MAQFELDNRYPDVLLVYGSDVYRRDFHHTLIGLPNSPVTNRSHDFWIIHFTSPMGTPTATPHGAHDDSRLKMFVNMEVDITTLDADRAAAYLNTFLHEVGHHWLVPPFSVILSGSAGPTPVGRLLGLLNTTLPWLPPLGDILRGSPGATPVRSTPAFIEAIFASADIPPLCLLAKTNDHWNCFMSAGQTTFEALDWRETGRFPLEGAEREGEEYENILRTYQTGTGTSFPADMGPLAGVNVGYPYSDLDLYLMGAITGAEAYPQDRGRFYELAPQWMTPVETLAGICLVFAPDDIYHFGFKHGHEQIGLQRTGNTSADIDISRFYPATDMANFDAHVAFRVVRRGDEYHFQFRREFMRAGCLGVLLEGLGLYRSPSPVDLFSDAEAIPPPVQNLTGLDRWNTLRTVTDTRAPIAGGYMVKTWGATPPLVDTHFKEFEIKAGGSVRTIANVTQEVTGPDYRGRLDSDFLFHKPHPGPALLRNRGWGHLVLGATVPDGRGGTREVGHHDHWAGVDRAPKLLTGLPGGDFVMGGKVKLQRVALAPHAAGVGVNKKLWAFRRARFVTDIRLNGEVAARRADRSPYRCAFMILSPDRASITDAMIRNVDAYRVAAPAVFGTATRGRRTITTTLR